MKNGVRNDIRVHASICRCENLSTLQGKDSQTLYGMAHFGKYLNFCDPYPILRPMTFSFFLFHC